MSTWVNASAGPRMVKQVNEAISGLNWEAKTFVEVTGVVGGESHRSVLTQPIGGVYREDVKRLGEEIGNRYGWKVTKENYRRILEDYAAALKTAEATRLERDERITLDEHRERTERLEAIHQEQAETSARNKAMREQIQAKAPASAYAVIVAELHEDTSDPMTDYFGNKTVRSVAIGFRLSKREDFQALRAAAGLFPETKHLGPDAPKDIEHRDNYSMGRGNYLSDHGWDGSGSGWVVKSWDLSGNWWRVDEDAIPEQPSSPPITFGQGYEIRPSSLGRAGVVEIHFAATPSH